MDLDQHIKKKKEIIKKIDKKIAKNPIGIKNLEDWKKNLKEDIKLLESIKKIKKPKIK